MVVRRQSLSAAVNTMLLTGLVFATEDEGLRTSDIGARSIAEWVDATGLEETIIEGIVEHHKQEFVRFELEKMPPVVKIRLSKEGIELAKIEKAIAERGVKGSTRKEIVTLLSRMNARALTTLENALNMAEKQGDFTLTEIQEMVAEALDDK